MRIFLLLLSIVLIGIGILWIGQGVGYIHWPERSFMIYNRQWSYYGAGLTVLGLLLLWRSGR